MSSSSSTRATRRWSQLLAAACLMLLSAVAPQGKLQAQAVLVLQPGSTAATLAGSGKDARTTAGDARHVALGSPQAIAYDAAGNLYIADKRNQQITRVDTAGQLTILAGTGRQGFAGDGGPATAAEWNRPSGIAVDASGNVFVADTGNERVRRISAVDGTVATVAGSGQPGFSGDGGPAQAARFRSPSSLALDGTGALYIADVGNHRVRRLNTDGTVVTVAGDGSQAQDGDDKAATATSLDMPSGLALLPDGRLLIADDAGRRVRVLQRDGTLAAYAAGASVLRRPAGLAVDADGSVYLADAAAQTVTQTSADGSSPVTGNGEQGSFIAGAPLATPLDTPKALASRANGDVAVSDTHNHRVQRISLPVLSFGSVPAGSQSQARIVTLQNGGGAALTVLAVELPGGFGQLNDGSTCSATPFILQAAQQCSIAINFAPVIQGAGDATARVRVLGGAPQALLLSGTGTAGGSLASSITSLRSDGSIAYAGSPIALTATVAGSLLASPIGNVIFLDGSTSIASSPLSAGSASLSTTVLSPGPHTLRAVYSGDAVYSSSTSPALAVTVVPSPDFTLTASAASYSGKARETVAIPMSLLPINGTLNRPVQFVVSGLPAGATATFAPATLTLGGDTAAVTLTLQMPPTLSRNHAVPGRYKVLAFLLGILGILPRRRASAALLAMSMFSICLSGCGSGFRAGTTAANLPGTTHNYTAVVTATTIGVLGTPLAHSTPIGLVITQ